MKKQYFFLMAAATLTFVGCSNDSIVDDPVSPPPVAEQEVPISFGSFKAQTTRADKTGAEAAALLGNKFVVSGYKGSSTGTVGSIVFDNYLVEYTENTAHTTQSNSTNWEYVGKGRIKHAIDHGITSQTIKYWDYSKDQYDFIAWSTGTKTAIYEGTPTAGQVLVSAINPNATATAAYTFKGKADDLSQCYIADLVTVKKDQYGDDPVTFRFRQLGTKVRIGIYETVPGYSVKDVKFYSAAASNDAQATNAKLFTTAANEIYTEGTYTVTFPTVDLPTNANNNQAHVTFAAKESTPGTPDPQSTVVNWGGMNYTIAEEGEKTAGYVFLGRSSSTASYAGDAANNYYVVYLPNEGGTNLNLRVNYTLESIDGSGEVIEVKGATAQVPSIYTQWKPGFAYTYLFKISDKTNGYTGVYDPTNPDNTTVNSDPAGLYPITFDAVVVNAEDNDKTQETITTISTPSITTYQKGSTVVNADEYKASGDIFVTVNDGNTESTPDLANGKLQTLTGKAALYTIPAGKTEAEVVDALQMQDDDAATGTIKGRSGLVLTEAASSLVNKVEFGVDGNAISVGDNQALRFTPTATTTYAFVYTKKAAVPANNVEKYQVVTKAAGDDVTGLYRNRVEAPAGDVQAGTAYFKNRVENFATTTVFVGQGVGSLFIDNTGTPAPTTYAVTGTTYYYGTTYSQATNIAYADFAGATDLYTYDGTTSTYTLKTETSPVNGTAYYQRTGAGTNEDPFVYTYCVILPQQTTGLFVEGYGACANSETAVAGVTYFDKYTKNDGVYYTKIIKVQ